MHDTLQEGSAAALQDVLTLRAANKLALPVTILQSQHAFVSFRILLQSMLGPLHPNTLAYSEFVYAFGQAVPEFEALALARPYFCTRLVRYEQIRLSNWFNQQSRSQIRVPPPDYNDLIGRIRNQESSWEPFLPSRYLLPAAPRAPTGENVPALRVPVPPATGPARGRTDATTLTPDQRQRISNTEYNKAYQVFKDKGLPLAQVRTHARAANDPVPTNERGIETCLCYHIHGYCWNNCSHLGDHQPQSAAEVARTVKWCTAHYI